MPADWPLEPELALDWPDEPSVILVLVDGKGLLAETETPVVGIAPPEEPVCPFVPVEDWLELVAPALLVLDWLPVVVVVAVVPEEGETTEVVTEPLVDTAGAPVDVEEPVLDWPELLVPELAGAVPEDADIVPTAPDPPVLDWPELLVLGALLCPPELEVLPEGGWLAAQIPVPTAVPVVATAVPDEAVGLEVVLVAGTA